MFATIIRYSGRHYNKVCCVVALLVLPWHLACCCGQLATGEYNADPSLGVDSTVAATRQNGGAVTFRGKQIAIGTLMPHLADVDRVHADIHLRVDKGVVGPDEALHDGGFYLRVAYVTQQKLSLFAVKKHHVDLPGEGGGGQAERK